MKALVQKLRRWAQALKLELYALYLAAHDPRVPWYAKALALATAAYALSPIDLIPDFIPVIGYLDDLVIVPLGIWLCLRIIPRDVMAECRARAEALSAERRKQELKARPLRWAGLAVIAGVWVAAAWVIGRVFWSWFAK